MKATLILSGCFLSLLQLSGQGLLTPPGAPAPTQKTLTQIEPRTPISSLPATVSASGSYYLTGNLTTTGNGVIVAADEVTIDLNGFAISSSASPATGTGIVISGVRRNVTIRNGHIRGTTTFSSGTFTTGGFSDGIQNASGATSNVRISEINVLGIASDGINFSTNAIPTAVVERCTVSVCGNVGILAGVVRDCSADTIGGTAIGGDLVVGCHGVTVGTASSGAQGISAGFAAENSRGIAVSGIGLSAVNVNNCRGQSTSGVGLGAVNVLNSEGVSTSGTAGISAAGGTVSFSRGQRNGGIAILCSNAIGCTVSGTGTVNASTKSLGTP